MTSSADPGRLPPLASSSEISLAASAGGTLHPAPKVGPRASKPKAAASAPQISPRDRPSGKFHKCPDVTRKPSFINFRSWIQRLLSTGSRRGRWRFQGELPCVGAPLHRRVTARCPTGQMLPGTTLFPADGIFFPARLIR